MFICSTFFTLVVERWEAYFYFYIGLWLVIPIQFLWKWRDFRKHSAQSFCDCHDLIWLVTCVVLPRFTSCNTLHLNLTTFSFQVNKNNSDYVESFSFIPWNLWNILEKKLFRNDFNNETFKKALKFENFWEFEAFLVNYH